MLRLLFTSVFAVLALSACNQVVEDTGPGQPVKHRQDAFKAMLRAFEPMGVMIRDKQYDANKFAGLAAELAARRDAPWPYFKPDTHYPPTKARAAVWERADEFEQERMKFVTATDELLVAAQSRSLEQVRPAYEKVYASCKSCHDSFKEK